MSDFVASFSIYCHELLCLKNAEKYSRIDMQSYTSSSIYQNMEVGYLELFKMIELQTHTHGRLFTYKDMTFKKKSNSDEEE